MVDVVQISTRILLRHSRSFPDYVIFKCPIEPSAQCLRIIYMEDQNIKEQPVGTKFSY